MSDLPSILIEEYDARWVDSFAALAARVKASLGDRVGRIEHVGSTAVTGLAAKPVIDLDVVVSPSDLREAIQHLERLGYVHEGDLRIAGREAFRSPPGTLTIAKRIRAASLPSSLACSRKLGRRHALLKVT